MQNFIIHQKICSLSGAPLLVCADKIAGHGIYFILMRDWQRMEFLNLRDKEEENERHVVIQSNREPVIDNCLNSSTPYKIIPNGKKEVILIIPPVLRVFVFIDPKLDVLSSDELDYTEMPQFNPGELVHKKWRMIENSDDTLIMSQLEQKLAFFIILVWACNHSNQEGHKEILRREHLFISRQIDNLRLIELHLFNLEQELLNPYNHQNLKKGWKNISL